MNRSGLIHHLQSFQAAVQFMTCVPVGSVEKVPDSAWRNMLLWYPVVGAAIGAVLIVGERLVFALDASLQAALLVLVWVILTGGLHLDGLADTTDAWVGGLGNRVRTLEIMKDPHCGPFAVIAVTMTLILKVAALTAFHNWIVLLLVPMAARLLIIPAFLWLPYAKESGVGADIQQAFSESRKKFGIAITVIGALLPLLFVPISLWLALVISGNVVYWLWRLTMMRRLQGFTGDCIGMLVELSELVLLFVFVIYETAT